MHNYVQNREVLPTRNFDSRGAPIPISIRDNMPLSTKESCKDQKMGHVSSLKFREKQDKNDCAAVNQGTQELQHCEPFTSVQNSG